jgi:lipoyl(octanoyl) transferase|tara:strand:+ start:53 stop:670 length:618 start_codon:yes stop_codon:yes gene_type:complete
MKIEIKKSSKYIDYDDALKLLEKRVEDVINGKKPELLWILEHKPTFTAGTSYKENEILNKRIKVIKTSRGGKITYHGPGQKVVYFVLNLNERGKDLRQLIRYIEKCIIQILKEYKIKSFNDNQNIGIWVNVNDKAEKVAAIGIRVKKWVAFHGFSINISNNLDVYRNIVPCGIYNKRITNLCSIKKNNYKNINQKIINNFLRTFK